MGRSQPASKLTGAIPANSIDKGCRVQRDNEDGFWDKATDQPALEQTSAHLLQHFSEPSNALNSKGPASVSVSGAINYILAISVDGQKAAYMQSLSSDRN